MRSARGKTVELPAVTMSPLTLNGSTMGNVIASIGSSAIGGTVFAIAH